MGLTQEGPGPRREGLWKTEKQLLIGWGCWGGEAGDSGQREASGGLLGGQKRVGG